MADEPEPVETKTAVEHEAGLQEWHREEAERVANLGEAARRFGYIIDTNEGDPDDDLDTPDNDDQGQPTRTG